MPSMHARFISTSSNLDHLFFLTSGHHILRYHRLRRNRLRAQLQRIEALLAETQATEIADNSDNNNEALVFVGLQFGAEAFPVLNPPRRAITV